VSFAAITLYVASQRVFTVAVYFVIDSPRKLLNIPSYVSPDGLSSSLLSSRLILRDYNKSKVNSKGTSTVAVLAHGSKSVRSMEDVCEELSSEI